MSPQKPSEQEWRPIFHSANRVDLLAIQDYLQAEGIEVVLLDQRDSMYPMLGQAVLLVAQKDELRAQELLNNFLTNEQPVKTDA